MKTKMDRYIGDVRVRCTFNTMRKWNKNTLTNPSLIEIYENGSYRKMTSRDWLALQGSSMEFTRPVKKEELDEKVVLLKGILDVIGRIRNEMNNWKDSNDIDEDVICRLVNASMDAEREISALRCCQNDQRRQKN